jgi:protein-L-isoaspartate(D-aspartate) O-methyltransferase
MLHTDSYLHQGRRSLLVQELIRKGITDNTVLNAIGKIPRHFFLDPVFERQAYEDRAFPIGEDQTISHPFTVAKQSELLLLEPGLKVLEIGTGSGYQAAVLAEIGVELHTIERHKPLTQTAANVLGKMGYQMHYYIGDGSMGLPAQAPYDRIIVTCGAPFPPEPLVDQLKPNGILVIPIGDGNEQEMFRITKKVSGITTEGFGKFAFVPLIGQHGWKN